MLSARGLDLARLIIGLEDLPGALRQQQILGSCQCGRTASRGLFLCRPDRNSPGRADRRRASPLVRPWQHGLRPLALRAGACSQARRLAQRRSLQRLGAPGRDGARDLAGGGFIAQQRNAVLVGGTGTGKTHLAIAIARSCIRSGARGRFYNVVDLVNRLETETRNGDPPTAPPVEPASTAMRLIRSVDVGSAAPTVLSG
jgi:hypothetical protein